MISSATASTGWAADTCRRSAEVLVDVGGLLGSVDLGSLEEDEAIELVRTVERSIRALQAVSTAIAHRLDERHAAGGCLSAADVFSCAGRLSSADAQRHSRRAGLIEHLPSLATALSDGTAPVQNVDAVAMARHKLRHDQRWQAAFDRKDPIIARRAVQMAPAKFHTWLSRLCQTMSDDGETAATEQTQRNGFRTWITGEGRVRGSFDLDALSGEIVRNAVRAEAKSLGAQSRLAGRAYHAGEHHDASALLSLLSSKSGPKARPLINVVVDLDTLRHGQHEDSMRYTSGGLDLPMSTIERLLCDAELRHVLLGDNGVPLAVGRTQRTATSAQRAALRVMYDSCIKCDVPFDSCKVHHIRFWEHGGLTNLDQLIPLCDRHHDEVHQHGWNYRLHPDRTIEILRPDNQTWVALALPNAEATRRRNDARRRRWQKRRNVDERRRLSAVE